MLLLLAPELNKPPLNKALLNLRFKEQGCISHDSSTNVKHLNTLCMDAVTIYNVSCNKPVKHDETASIWHARLTEDNACLNIHWFRCYTLRLFFTKTKNMNTHIALMLRLGTLFCSPLGSASLSPAVSTDCEGQLLLRACCCCCWLWAPLIALYKSKCIALGSRGEPGGRQDLEHRSFSTSQDMQQVQLIMRQASSHDFPPLNSVIGYLSPGKPHGAGAEDRWGSHSDTTREQALPMLIAGRSLTRQWARSGWAAACCVSDADRLAGRQAERGWVRAGRALSEIGRRTLKHCRQCC